MSPRLPLSKIYPQIIEKFGVSADSHLFMELRHPEQKDMTLDISRCLDDYKIRELFLADKRGMESCLIVSSLIDFMCVKPKLKMFFTRYWVDLF